MENNKLASRNGNDEMSGEPIFFGKEVTSLEFLQAVYRNNDLPLSVRMRAAAIAINFESPKLAVIGHVAEDGSFAERLDRALSRSGMKVIEHLPNEDAS
jgi:hypothetical protein